MKPNKPIPQKPQALPSKPGRPGLTPVRPGVRPPVLKPTPGRPRPGIQRPVLRPGTRPGSAPLGQMQKPAYDKGAAKKAALAAFGNR